MQKTNQKLSLLLIVQIVVIQLLAFLPHWVEKYYSTGIYPYLSVIFRTVFGWIPFSVGDFLYLFLFFYAVRFIVKIFKGKRKRFISILYQTGAALSVLYFLFYFLWGLNYSREPIEKSLNMSKPEYKVETLELFSEKILNRLTEVHRKLTGNDTLKVNVSLAKKEILLLTRAGYDELAVKFPQYNYHPASIKRSLFSLPLTYMGFSGYYNPFSGEAQVDGLVPKVSLPMIASHEVAHQLGIASESEANFIGFLAAYHNKEPLFQYSALLMAYRYALSDLRKQNSKRYDEFLSRTPEGVLKNIREIQHFWQKYQNVTEPFFKIFYDNYLKMNQQKHGIQSYSKMIDLLLAYDKKYKL